VDALGRTWLWATEKLRVKQLVTRSRLTRPVVDRFIAGNDIDAAVQAVRALNERRIGGILDFLGEGVASADEASAAAGHYLSAIGRVTESGIDTTVSIKLTQLGLVFDKGACIDHLRRIAAEAQAAGVGVEIDMEQSEHVADTVDVFRLLRGDFPDLRLAMQAYLRRTPGDLESMAVDRPWVRLVKGAYAEPASQALQKRGEIEEQYKFLTDWLFDNSERPAIATHDRALIAHAKEAALRTHTDKDGFEIQMLYGIRRSMQARLADEGYRVRVYVPYGSAWYPYLMRRIAERPANLRFFLRSLVGG
jgi:proline dehydrogenase